jgi:hypothetical protein
MLSTSSGHLPSPTIIVIIAIVLIIGAITMTKKGKDNE